MDGGVAMAALWLSRRGKLIPVISARDMTRKERRIYQTHEKTEEKDNS
jgi:uncharacterized DUF497 family protein